MTYGNRNFLVFVSDCEGADVMSTYICIYTRPQGGCLNFGCEDYNFFTMAGYCCYGIFCDF